MTEFPLPELALSNHTAVVGKTGSGKSSTGRLIVEHVVSEDYRVCVLDPVKSDWRGIVSNAAGDGPGLPFQILGGPYGHVQIDRKAGAVVGKLVAEGAIPLSVIDMKRFGAGGAQEFFTAFAESLLENIKGVLYLVMEEAHEFAPKERPGISKGNENLSIYWAKTLATAGRSEGIRLIVATQRVQALHNAVFGSCETMLIHRLSAPADKKPVLEWINDNAENKVESEEIKRSLKSLKNGEAWVLSGEAEVFKCIQFPKFETYDNMATPTKDSVRQQVISAAVDVGRLRAIIGEAAKEVEANDPKALKARVAELEKQLEGKAPTAQPVDISAALAKGIEEATNPLVRRIDTLENFIAEARSEAEALHRASGILNARFTFGESQIEESYRAKPEPPEPVSVGATIIPPPIQRIVTDRTVSKHQRMLAMLAELRSTGIKLVDRRVLAGLTKQSHKSSSYDQALRELRQQGLIRTDGGLSLTPDGAKVAGKTGKPPTLADLHGTLRKFLSRSAVRCLEVVIRLHPKPVERLDIAKISGMSSTSSSFDGGLRELRSYGLIQGSKVIEGTSLLFPEGQLGPVNHSQVTELGNELEGLR